MQMNRDEITEKLKEIMLAADDRNNAAIYSCTEASNLSTDLGFSSVAMLYMVIAIEEEFGIRFENVGTSDFVTLGDVIDYIEGKLR